MIEPIPKTGKKKNNKDQKWLRFRKGWLKKQPTNWIGEFQCAHCGAWLPLSETTVDHIIKRSVAPDRVFDDTNLQILCGSCHFKKDF